MVSTRTRTCARTQYFLYIKPTCTLLEQRSLNAYMKYIKRFMVVFLVTITGFVMPLTNLYSHYPDEMRRADELDENHANEYFSRWNINVRQTITSLSKVLLIFQMGFCVQDAVLGDVWVRGGSGHWRCRCSTWKQNDPNWEHHFTWDGHEHEKGWNNIETQLYYWNILVFTFIFLTGCTFVCFFIQIQDFFGPAFSGFSTLLFWFCWTCWLLCLCIPTK